MSACSKKCVAPTLNQIYCNPSITKQINETEDGVVQHAKTAFARASRDLEQIALLDFLVCPDANGFPRHTAKTISTAKSMVLSLMPVQWHLVGVYSRIHIAVMTRMREFAVQACSIDPSLLISPNPTPEQINKVAGEATLASQALACKYAWLYFRSEIWTPEQKKIKFTGVPAITTPVRKYLSTQMRICNPNHIESLRWTEQVAEDLGGIDPIYVNTAMWVLGRAA
jgi:hypothetical protein